MENIFFFSQINFQSHSEAEIKASAEAVRHLGIIMINSPPEDSQMSGLTGVNSQVKEVEPFHFYSLKLAFAGGLTSSFFL